MKAARETRVPLWRWSPRKLAWLASSFIALLIAQAGWEIWRGHQEALEASRRDLDAQSRVIAEQTARGIQAVDVVLKYLAQQLSAGGLESADPDRLHHILKEQGVGLVQAHGLLAFGADGVLRASSRHQPDRLPNVNAGNLPAFLALRADATDSLHVENVSPSISTPGKVIPLGRRIVGKGGEFMGVVGAPGRIEYFQDFYREAYGERGVRIALLHRSGWLLARHPAADAVLGRRLEMLNKLMPPHSPDLVVRARMPSPIDNADHLLALRAVPGYPLVVAVSLDGSNALLEWRQHAWATALRTLALGSMAAVLLWLTLRQLVVAQSAQRSLETSRERYALAAAGSDVGIWDWDLVAQTAYESQRARELQGLPLEPETQPLAELRAAQPCHPEDVEARRLAMRSHLEGHTPYYDHEYRVPHADGGYRWVHARGLCTRDEDGQPLRIAGSISDIDARKSAEDALRESEAQYALAMTGSNEGHWMWDMPSKRVYVSARLAEFFGLPGGAQHMPDETYFSAIPVHPDDQAKVRRNREDHVAGLTPRLDHEFRVILPGTEEVRWMHTRAQCFRDSNGQPLRMAGSTVDATLRKRAEENLRLSEERYALAMTGSRGGHWVLDLKSDTLFVSAAVNQLYGGQPEAKSVSRLAYYAGVPLHPDDVARVVATSNDMVAGRVSRVDHEYRVVLPEGERWILTRAQRFDESNGQRPVVAGISVDISDRKRAEMERLALESQLRQAQKLEAIGTLAGGIAHDFNNILSAILGYGELAQKGAADGSALRRHIDAAMSAGLRAKSMVERILAFSRAGLGERVPVHVQTVVEEALEAIGATLPAGIQLHRHLAAGSASVIGDPTQIHQVVMNLCTNAVQAMKAGGQLQVALECVTLGEGLPVATSQLAAGNYVRLTVSDSGEGIGTNVLARIFDPFFTTKEVGVGTGLGLSLVHGIVGDLGGGIAVDSIPQVGSRFSVYLPYRHHEVDDRKALSASVPRGDGQTILIVDDEETLVRLSEEALAEMGYEPRGFTSGAQALQALQDGLDQYDAVLTDEAMPGLTGTELVARLRAICPTMPVLLMSGVVTPGLMERARQHGVVEVLGKPLALNELARALARVFSTCQPAEKDGI